MNRTIFRLRFTTEPSLSLERAGPDGPFDPVMAPSGEVERMYDGLVEALNGVFRKFQRPRDGEMGGDFPYPTPVGLLTERLPESIRTALADAAATAWPDGPPVLLLTVNDPFPWEVVRTQPETKMLGQVFDVARFDGECTEPTVEVAGVLVIAPAPTGDAGQCDVDGGIFGDQHQVIACHFSDSVQTLLDCSTGTLDGVITELNQSSPRLVHYMGHHFLDAANPMESSLQLANGDRLRPQDVADRVHPPGDGKKWPWVFLNSCEAGAGIQADDALDEAGPPWPTVFEAAGAHMTIGPYWKVNKTHSVDLAIDFYQTLLGEHWTLGAAMRAIRSTPCPPTQIAYTLYGDPTMRVELSRDAVPPSNRVCPPPLTDPRVTTLPAEQPERPPSGD